MPANCDPRRRSDAVRNRALVLAATKELLAEADAVLTVEAIGRRAGVGAATVVRSFGTKEALLDAAVAELLGPLVQRGRDALEELAAPDARAALRGFLVDVMAFQSAHRLTGGRLAGLTLPATDAARADLMAVALGLVRRAQEAGVVRVDLDAATLTTLIGEMSYAVSGAAVGSPGLVDGYLTVLLDGLRPPRP